MARLEEKMSRSPLYSPVGTLMLIAALGPGLLYALNLLAWAETLAVPLAYGMTLLGSLPLLCIPYLARSFFLDTRARLGLFALMASLLSSLSFQAFAWAEWLSGAASSQLWVYTTRERLFAALVSTSLTLFACGMRFSREDPGQALPRGAWLALLIDLLASGTALLLDPGAENTSSYSLTALALCTFSFALNASLLLRVAIYQRSLLVSSLACGQLSLSLCTALSVASYSGTSLGEALLLHAIAQLYGLYILGASLVWHLRRQNLAPQEQPARRAEDAHEELSLVTQFRNQFAPSLVELVAKSEEALMNTAPQVPPAKLQALYELNHMSWNLLQRVDELDHFLARSQAPQASKQIRKIPVTALMLRLQRMAQRFADPHFVHVDAFYPEHLGDIETDEVLLLQACLPLLRNAIRYTQNARVTLHLYPIVREGKACLRLDIRDWGRGLSSLQHQNLKAAAHRELGSLAQLAQSSGIPLAQNICASLDAELVMESRIGTGTTWGLIWEDTLAASRKDCDLTPELSAKAAVLLAQTAQVRGVVEAPLVDLGMQLYATQNLSSSLRLIVEMQPSLLFVELGAEGPGFDLLDTLQPYLKHTQIVGLLPQNAQASKSEALARGATTVVETTALVQDLPQIVRSRSRSAQ